MDLFLQSINDGQLIKLRSLIKHYLKIQQVILETHLCNTYILGVFVCVCGEATDNLIIAKTKDEIRKSIALIDANINKEGGEGCHEPIYYNLVSEEIIDIEIGKFYFKSGQFMFDRGDGTVLIDKLEYNQVYCIHETKTEQLLYGKIEELISSTKTLLSSVTSDPNTKKHCMARTHTGQQCCRKSHANHHLCGGHLHALPYGRIDQLVDCLVKKNTKGRKSKKLILNLDQIDMSQYIKTQPIQINGQEYLIDEYGVVYENDRANTIVAHQDANGQYEWFT